MFGLYANLILAECHRCLLADNKPQLLAFYNASVRVFSCALILHKSDTCDFSSGVQAFGYIRSIYDLNSLLFLLLSQWGGWACGIDHTGNTFFLSFFFFFEKGNTILISEHINFFFWVCFAGDLN